MNIKNNNFLKNDIIEIQLSNDESNFYLYIYFSKNKSSIIFKIKELNICDNYFYEKYDLRDFSKKYKRIISDESIEDAFIDIKNIIKSHNIMYLILFVKGQIIKCLNGLNLQIFLKNFLM